MLNYELMKAVLTLRVAGGNTRMIFLPASEIRGFNITEGAESDEGVIEEVGLIPDECESTMRRELDGMENTTFHTFDTLEEFVMQMMGGKMMLAGPEVCD